MPDLAITNADSATSSSTMPPPISTIKPRKRTEIAIRGSSSNPDVSSNLSRGKPQQRIEMTDQDDRTQNELKARGGYTRDGSFQRIDSRHSTHALNPTFAGIS